MVVGRWSLVVDDRRMGIVLGRSRSTMGSFWMVVGRYRWSLSLVVLGSRWSFSLVAGRWSLSLVGAGCRTTGTVLDGRRRTASVVGWAHSAVLRVVPTVFAK